MKSEITVLLLTLLVKMKKMLQDAVRTTHHETKSSTLMLSVQQSHGVTPRLYVFLTTITCVGYILR